MTVEMFAIKSFVRWSLYRLLIGQEAKGGKRNRGSSISDFIREVSDSKLGGTPTVMTDVRGFLQSQSRVVIVP